MNSQWALQQKTRRIKLQKIRGTQNGCPAVHLGVRLQRLLLMSASQRLARTPVDQSVNQPDSVESLDSSQRMGQSRVLGLLLWLRALIRSAHLVKPSRMWKFFFTPSAARIRRTPQ